MDELYLAAIGAAVLLFIMFNNNETTTRDDSDPVPDSYSDPTSSGGTTGAVNRPTYEGILRGGIA
jgi:hypothetical protein